ncbi:hypothetical protein HanRHA438_Chr04g0150191 [Helianthus annuus]|nr:hypothetical protein HanRHA438_Chr04g0150191 [Helianthus annuus]
MFLPAHTHTHQSITYKLQYTHRHGMRDEEDTCSINATTNTVIKRVAVSKS